MTLNMIVPLEVGIAVRDLPRMRRFYEQVLGFAFVSEVAVPAASAVQAAMHAGGYTAVRLQTSYGERIKLLAPNSGNIPMESRLNDGKRICRLAELARQ